MKTTRIRPGSVIATLTLLFLLLGQTTTPANAQAVTASSPTTTAMGPIKFMATKPTSVRPLVSPQSVITGPLINHNNQGTRISAQAEPAVYVVYWGWTSDPYGEQAYLENFLSSVGGTPWLNTVVQYSYAGYTIDAGGSASVPGLFVYSYSDPSPIPDQPTDAQIQSEVSAFVTASGLTPGDGGLSPNVEIVIATPTGHSTAGFGVSYCAYHSYTLVAAGAYVSYTNLPYMPDAGGACGANAVNGPLDGVSIVEGHELAESLTDPFLYSWYDASGNEVGDKCAWTNLADITTVYGTFAVQPLWSNHANGCVLSTVPTVLP